MADEGLAGSSFEDKAGTCLATCVVCCVCACETLGRRQSNLLSSPKKHLHVSPSLLKFRRQNKGPKLRGQGNRYTLPIGLVSMWFGVRCASKMPFQEIQPPLPQANHHRQKQESSHTHHHVLITFLSFLVPSLCFIIFWFSPSSLASDFGYLDSSLSLRRSYLSV